MTLLAGQVLSRKNLLRGGNPKKRASGYDLTIGGIFDETGQEITGPYVLKPNEMVQVTSAERFDLPRNISAHVSYKTSMTHKGVWALTVGVVDPGWNCPVSTTLLNFSKVNYPVRRGDPLLRVSFFKHASVAEDEIRRGPTTEDYEKQVSDRAVTTFGAQFLNTDAVAREAGKVAMQEMRNSALKWIAAIAFMISVLQLITAWLAPAAYDGRHRIQPLEQQVEELKAELSSLAVKIEAQEHPARSSASPQETLEPNSAAGNKAEAE